jgi:hypothetical protein
VPSSRRRTSHTPRGVEPGGTSAVLENRVFSGVVEHVLGCATERTVKAAAQIRQEPLNEGIEGGVISTK